LKSQLYALSILRAKPQWRVLIDALECLMRDCLTPRDAESKRSPSHGDADGDECELMPWHCPACQTTIAHKDTEDRPRVGIVYRCYVCRLELTMNPTSEKLELAPLPAHHKPDRER
jgi:hypothetical protein